MNGMINEYDKTELLRVIIFKGDHEHLNFFVDQMITYLTLRGIVYYTVDSNDPCTYQCSEFNDFILQPECV